jgi:hypothetical protein
MLSPTLSKAARALRVFGVLFACIQAYASTVVVSTLKSAPTCCGEAIGIGDPNVRLQEAVRFVASSDYVLDSIAFDLISSFGNGDIVAQIYSESGGLPDTLVYSAAASSAAPAQGGLFTIQTPEPFTVRAGQAYWLTATNTDPNSGSY